MSQRAVDSLHDPDLEPYRDLRHGSRDTGLFVVEGSTLARKLLESPLETHSILISDRFESGWHFPDELTVLVADHSLLQEIVGFSFHRGILACARRPPSQSFPEVVERFESDRVRILACDAVQDPANLGAMLRSAHAFGADHVVLSSDCADEYSRRVARVSMGSVLDLSIERCPSLPQALESMKRCGIVIVSTVLDRDAIRLKQYRSSDKIALVVGNEGHGISEAVDQLSDTRLMIPISSEFDSLNVSVAAGIAMYELFGEPRNAD